MRVPICGGGVIGACIAYFLSLRGIEAVAVERAGVAYAASGKSGGFLARDWCDGTPVAALARRGSDLHAELAQNPERSWGYRRVGAPGVAGAFVATGHSVRGMLNGPSTGEAMAELIADGATSKVDLRPFDPARLAPLDPEALRA